MLISSYTLIEDDDLDDIQGLYAADGSFNVVDSSGETVHVGIYHPCGALWVTFTEELNPPVYAPNGSFYVYQEAEEE